MLDKLDENGNPVRDSSSVEKGKSTTTPHAVRYADK